MYYNDKELDRLAMPSLGLQLRLERERQKLDLSLIAEETRINLSYLEAIEADDLSALPGEFFYRSFVRQYSKYLGIPAAEADKMFESSSALAAGAAEAVAPSFGIYASKEEEDRSIKALAESLKDKPLRPPQDDGMSRNWLIIAALMIVGCGAYFAWRNFSPAVPALPSLSQAQQTKQPESKPPEAKPTEPAPVVPQTAVAPEPTPNTPPTTTTPETTPAAKPEVTPAKPETATATTASVATTATTATTTGKGPVSVTVIAKEMTWIRITADGQKVFGGTIDPGQQRTVQGRDLEVIVGNAGTLDVIYQGKPLNFGTKGQVKTLLFSPEGWKIKPKPVADPNAPAATPPASVGF